MKQFIFIFSVFVFSFPAFAQAETCPKIAVTGGGVVQAGESMTFTVQITGSINNSNLEYQWKISSGTIASGQGTASISIDTTGLAGGTNILAEVKIKGLPGNCSDTASEVGSTTPFCPEARLLDEIGKLSRSEFQERLNAFFVVLKNEPNSQGYIINYGTDREIAARERQIRDNIGFRKYDASRITFVRGGENPGGEAEAWTKLFIVPPGAVPPNPE